MTQGDETYFSARASRPECRLVLDPMKGAVSRRSAFPLALIEAACVLST